MLEEKVSWAFVFMICGHGRAFDPTDTSAACFHTLGGRVLLDGLSSNYMFVDAGAPYMPVPGSTEVVVLRVYIVVRRSPYGYTNP
eukprot:287863-Rhodomonas_salina.1